MLGDFVLEVIGTPMMQEVSMMERAASTGFEGIAQMLLEQKKLMDALEAENRELRRQLADLRHGVGVAVVIEGKTIQLATDASNNGQSTLQSLQNLQNTPPMSSNYGQGGRQTGSQQSVNPGSDKRENGTTRSPLADSFVL